jgi:hypothetical protein
LSLSGLTAAPAVQLAEAPSAEDNDHLITAEERLRIAMARQ